MIETIIFCMDSRDCAEFAKVKWFGILVFFMRFFGFNVTRSNAVMLISRLCTSC